VRKEEKVMFSVQTPEFDQNKYLGRF